MSGFRCDSIEQAPSNGKDTSVGGWATRSENGIFGGATYHWVPGDASWVAQNLWDHYAFTHDKEYLRKIRNES